MGTEHRDHDRDHHHGDHGDHGRGHGQGQAPPGRRRSRLGRAARALLVPHHHDSAGSIDSALVATDAGIRAVKVSLAVLAATAAVQVVVTIATGSVALLADTIHNLSDALTAIPLGIAFALSRRRPTKRYTYGYGRAEDLAGVFVVSMIALSAAVAFWESAGRLIDPSPVRNTAWVLLAGLVGFAGNEWVAVYRIRTGRRIGSAALIADGYHARTDGLTSLAVVAGALGSAAGWARADPVVGILISAAILAVLIRAGRDVYRRLMDSVDPSLVDRVAAIVTATPGIETVEAVRIRWVGHELHCEAEVVSDCELTLAEAHAIGEEARHRLLHGITRLTGVTIHTSPCTHDGRDPHGAIAHHFHGITETQEHP